MAHGFRHVPEQRTATPPHPPRCYLCGACTDTGPSHHLCKEIIYGTAMAPTTMIPFDLRLPDGTDENGVYHGPWNLLPRKAGHVPWECSLHGHMETGTCPQCKVEHAEHSRTCGPSMSCPWWRKTLGWEGM